MRQTLKLISEWGVFEKTKHMLRGFGSHRAKDLTFKASLGFFKQRLCPLCHGLFGGMFTQYSTFPT